MSERILVFRWSISHAPDTYGYNICTLYVDGRKAAQCDGGGYDMEGTCLGTFIANAYPDRLRKLDTEFRGLTFHDPDYKTSSEIVEQENRGESLGLARYQAFYAASSRVPTERHTVPSINGAHGFSAVEDIGRAISVNLQYVDRGERQSKYLLTD